MLSYHRYESVDSTNSEAIRNISSFPSGSVLTAYEQTAGRGQRGNKWMTKPGENLMFSLVLKPSGFAAMDQFLICEAAALAVKESLVSAGVPAKVKWPNDIYVGDRKICGILIENGLAPDGTIAWSVIGIGLNVNQTDFPPEILNPVSMKKILHKDIPLEPLMEEICTQIESDIMGTSDVEGLRSRYLDGLYRIGEWHEWTDCLAGCSIVGRITGVTQFGKLIVETKEGKLKEFAFKEISYII